MVTVDGPITPLKGGAILTATAINEIALQNFVDLQFPSSRYGWISGFEICF